jgi:excisionase family DNA binding protein
MTLSLLTALLTVKEMATRLQVKDKTVYAWTSQHKIPCVRVNGVIRFDAREIELWLQKCHVPVGVPCTSSVSKRRGSATSVDHLIESAKRAVYNSHGETRPIASPNGKERTNGAR